jgi:hypothetical protein
MRSWNWNLNFSVTKEYKIGWSTVQAPQLALLLQLGGIAIMTDADPFRNTTKKAWPAHDPSAEIPRDHGEVDLPWQDHFRNPPPAKGSGEKKSESCFKTTGREKTKRARKKAKKRKKCCASTTDIRNERDVQERQRKNIPRAISWSRLRIRPYG